MHTSPTLDPPRTHPRALSYLGPIIYLPCQFLGPCPVSGTRARPGVAKSQPDVPHLRCAHGLAASTRHGAVASPLVSQPLFKPDAVACHGSGKIPLTKVRMNGPWDYDETTQLRLLPSCPRSNPCHISQNHSPSRTPRTVNLPMSPLPVWLLQVGSLSGIVSRPSSRGKEGQYDRF